MTKDVNSLTTPAEIENFLECEAMPTVAAMRALFKSIKAMTKQFDTLHELANHGQYLGDMIHNDVDVVRAELRNARVPLPVE